MKRRLNPIIIKKIDQSDLADPVKKAVKNILEKEFEYAESPNTFYDNLIKEEIENAYVKMHPR
jgi:hypothetical protein